MICPICGEEMSGDGIGMVFHCPNTTEDIQCIEPDASPVLCEDPDERMRDICYGKARK